MSGWPALVAKPGYCGATSNCLIPLNCWRSPSPSLNMPFARHSHQATAGVGLVSSPRSGSPQRASTALRTASRNRSTDAKSAPEGAIGSRTSTLMGARRGNHCSPRSIDRVPRMTPGRTGRFASAATLKAPRKKPGEAGPARERAFGKEHQHTALLGRGNHGLGIGETIHHVVSLNKQCAQAAQHRTGEDLAGEFTLGNKGRLTGKRCRQHHRIYVARMVEHQHGVTAWNALGPTNRDRSSDRGEGHACNRSQRGPAPLEPGKDHNDQPSDQDAEPDDEPPPDRISEFG